MRSSDCSSLGRCTGWRNDRPKIRLVLAGARVDPFVLPLENLSGDPSQEYFVDGMTDALITNLSKIGALRVISRTSVMQYKGARRPLSEIAKRLEVDAIVEGTVVRSGNHIRINAQLIHAATDRHLWANAYERDLADIVALQGDVARAIAAEIQIKLTPQEQTHLARARAVNSQAYEHYLRGRFFLEKRTDTAIRTAMQYFQQAIDLQPDYAEAYAGLAQCYVMGGGALKSNMPTKLKEAAEAARRAIALDPTLAAPHATLARGAAYQDGDREEIEREFQTALRLDPNSALTYEWRGIYYTWIGRPESAVTEYKKALTLDPASPRLNARLGQGLASLNRFDDAVVQLNRALEMDPHLWITHTMLGDLYERQGRWQEAIVEYRKSEQISGDPLTELPDEEVLIAIAEGMLGNKKAALAMLPKAESVGWMKSSPIELAALNVAAGRKERALRILEEKCLERESRCDLSLPWPAFNSLRKDPRFSAVWSRSVH